MRAVGQAHRARGARDLLHDDHVREVAEAGAAAALGHGDAEQALLAERRPQVARKLVAAVDLLRRAGRSARRRSAAPAGGSPRSPRRGRNRCRCSRARSWACLPLGQDRMIVGQTGNRDKRHAPHRLPGRVALARNSGTTSAPCARWPRTCGARSAARPAAAPRPRWTSTRPPASSPARERIRVLLDTGSPFLEFSQLAAHGMYGGDIACGGHRHRHRPRQRARVRRSWPTIRP